MKCIVSRKSMMTEKYDKNYPPCDEAVWSEKDGCWLVSFQSAEEIHEFVEKYDELIIRQTQKGLDLIIYDDYHE